MCHSVVEVSVSFSISSCGFIVTVGARDKLHLNTSRTRQSAVISPFCRRLMMSARSTRDSKRVNTLRRCRHTLPSIMGGTDTCLRLAVSAVQADGGPLALDLVCTGWSVSVWPQAARRSVNIHEPPLLTPPPAQTNQMADNANASAMFRMSQGT